MQGRSETGNYHDSIKTAAWLVLWTFAWTATVAVAKFGPEHVWGSQQPAASWAAVVANLAIGVGWVVAFTRFLRGQDELHRKIIQDALAVALGAGWVAGFAYVVADAAGLITNDVNIAVLPILLAVVFVLTISVGKIRYR